MTTTPAHVREGLVEALELDLVGPEPDNEDHAEEILPQSPSKWYLTGFLVPFQAPLQQKSDGTSEEQLDVVGEPVAADDDDAPEKASARKVLFPSSLGMSFLVAADASELEVEAHWGEYEPHDPAAGKAAEVAEGESGGTEDPNVYWKRSPGHAAVKLKIEPETTKREIELDGTDGLHLVLSLRDVPAGTGVEEGARSASLFLVNQRTPKKDYLRDAAYLFQARLSVSCALPLVPRPDTRGRTLDDWDENLADLQYRDAAEYAVGHNVATHAVLDESRDCRLIRTTWIPQEDVEKVVAGKDLGKGVDLHLEALGQAESGEKVQEMLGGMVGAYATWLANQKLTLPEDEARADVARTLLAEADAVNQRIEDGIRVLAEDPDALEAFKAANRAVAKALGQRDIEDPEWRPFQLAFFLMNLRGVVDPSAKCREAVDLLFFPTGGGKTEAYLGLAAFTLVLRRLRNPGIQSAGVSVLMRYTLRLLTLDQLGRAATLVCALELERQAAPEKFGPWPFEIGLWVGSAATPNYMGGPGDKSKHSAYARTMAFRSKSKDRPSPIPLENCPWCGTKFTPNSFQLLPPGAKKPTDLRVACASRRCAFSGDNPLPLLSVDEPIYRRLPSFLIATVDKFAALPWVGETGALFGKVERADEDGFYGPSAPGRGDPLDAPLPAPDLIIQDELHLISGPLGTMVGLYETAIDELCSRRDGTETIRPKIVASTATVRRATRQIRALFGRKAVYVFPPPGPDYRDSFFARTVTVDEKHGRRYVGVAAQGRSLKVVLLRTCLALLSAAQRQWEAGDVKSPKNPADPYMTLLGYFNSLRELGGSRRIVEDEVNSRLSRYGERRRYGEEDGPFANRVIQQEVFELTSRVPTNKVAETKRRLSQTFENDDHVDVALATNMISVGLDITRLGLMVMLGQPKAAAEYIQASSRVGRDDDRPGLVVTLLNVHRPRDRSHYERFRAWHRTFYRSVEATSVTPFSPRAVDRGLAGVTVALTRHLHSELASDPDAVKMAEMEHVADRVADIVAARAELHDDELMEAAEELRKTIRGRTLDLLSSWEQIAIDNMKSEHRVGLYYQASNPPLLRDPLDPDLDTLSDHEKKFTAGRSLRDVEQSVNLWLDRTRGKEAGA